MLVLTWEKAPSLFAADLFECARAYFGDNLVKPLRASVNALGPCSGLRILVEQRLGMP